MVHVEPLGNVEREERFGVAGDEEAGRSRSSGGGGSGLPPSES
jgi:hypothetical protein